MYYFKNDSVVSTEQSDGKDLLIFARACDINAIRRLDSIFLKNGNRADMFYGRMRSRVKFALMECRESFEDCFCASVGSNITDDYSFAVRIDENDLLIDVKDEEFSGLFSDMPTDKFSVSFVSENKKVLRKPTITQEQLREISNLPFWSEFDEKCIACGGCNTVCGTCSCFDTVDVLYSEGSNDGERRRVWSSCMLHDFTQTAGGALSRKTQGANMRFKVLHKFYDYGKHFELNENMCVGCGRCDMRCPENISFFETVCRLHDEIERMGIDNKAKKAEG
jgi:anaerobic sulfite reductase subunit A